MAKCHRCGGYTGAFVMSPRCTCQQEQQGSGCLSLLLPFTVFDIITPVVTVGEQIKNGPLEHTIFIPYKRAVKENHDKKDIERILKDSGIKTWGSLVQPWGEMQICVKREQAERAYQALSRAGVPINGKSAR